ncbi:MAG: hypothetical protein ACREFS_06875 [Acetobacteraceae bacterium]
MLSVVAEPPPQKPGEAGHDQDPDQHICMMEQGLQLRVVLPAPAKLVAAAQQHFARSGIGIRVVSGGGTPNAWHAHETPSLAEVRAGTYIYHDRARVGAGAASLADCALHLHANIVSRPTAERAVMDAGTKSLTSDQVPAAAARSLARCAARGRARRGEGLRLSSHGAHPGPGRLVHLAGHGGRSSVRRAWSGGGVRGASIGLVRPCGPAR